MYVCMYVALCLGVRACRPTNDRNDLKHGAVLDLDTVLIAAYWIQKVKGQG